MTYTVKFTDYFQQVTKQRLIRLVRGGAAAGIILDSILFLLGIPDMMPYVLLGVIVILLLALIYWLDFHFLVFNRR